MGAGTGAFGGRGDSDGRWLDKAAEGLKETKARLERELREGIARESAAAFVAKMTADLNARRGP